MTSRDGNHRQDTDSFHRNHSPDMHRISTMVGGEVYISGYIELKHKLYVTCYRKRYLGPLLQVTG